MNSTFISLLTKETMNLRALKSKTLNLKVVPKHTLLHLGIAKKRLAFSLFHIAHVTQFIIGGPTCWTFHFQE